MSRKKLGCEIREKGARRAPDAATPATSGAAAAAGRERELLRHELMNLQQMNLSLQAVLHMVVSFKKTIEEVIQNSDHLAELNEGWSTFFGIQRTRIPN